MRNLNIPGYLKDHDMFGHSIVLNFDKNGDTHNTLIGGIISIMVKIGITVYIFLMSKKLVQSGGDELLRTEFLAAKDPDYNGKVWFNDT